MAVLVPDKKLARFILFDKNVFGQIDLAFYPGPWLPPLASQYLCFLHKLFPLISVLLRQIQLLGFFLPPYAAA